MRDGSKWVPWLAAALVLAAAVGVTLYLRRQGESAPPAPVATVAPQGSPAATAPTAPAPVAPAPEAAPAVPLPALEASDAEALQALQDLVGGDALTALLEPQYLIARIVATVDNLPRRAVAVRMLPTKPVAGAFLALDLGGTTVIAPQNAARYDTHVRLLQAIDAQRLVALYRRWQPLFQQAYRELGYPQGDFDARLVEVIDHLLAAPAAPEPVAVTRPKVLYEYVDPALESRSAGERVLLRIGNAHAITVKAKLREIRAALAAAPPPAAG